MSVRRRPPPRVAAAALPLAAAGSLHGPAIGFKPGRAPPAHNTLPVGGPVKFRPEDLVDEKGEPLLDQLTFKTLVPNTVHGLVVGVSRKKLDKTGWEIKVGDTWQKLLAGTVWAIYIAAGERNLNPTNPFTREPMGRDDYEALKALYWSTTTAAEWNAMRALERRMEWDLTPYTMDPAYRARQLELRGQDEAPEEEAEDEEDEVEALTEEEMKRLREGLRDDAGRLVEDADAAALADVQRRQDRLVAEAANARLRGRGEPLVRIPDDPNEDVVLTAEQRQIGNDMLAGRLARELERDQNLLNLRHAQGDGRSLADAPPPADLTVEESERNAEEAQFAADMERARLASLGGETMPTPANPGPGREALLANILRGQRREVRSIIRWRIYFWEDEMPAAFSATLFRNDLVDMVTRWRNELYGEFVDRSDWAPPIVRGIVPVPFRMLRGYRSPSDARPSPIRYVDFSQQLPDPHFRPFADAVAEAGNNNYWPGILGMAPAAFLTVAQHPGQYTFIRDGDLPPSSVPDSLARRNALNVPLAPEADAEEVTPEQPPETIIHWRIYLWGTAQDLFAEGPQLRQQFNGRVLAGAHTYIREHVPFRVPSGVVGGLVNPAPPLIVRNDFVIYDISYIDFELELENSTQVDRVRGVLEGMDTGPGGGHALWSRVLGIPSYRILTRAELPAQFTISTTGPLERPDPITLPAGLFPTRLLAVLNAPQPQQAPAAAPANESVSWRLWVEADGQANEAEAASMATRVRANVFQHLRNRGGVNTTPGLPELIVTPYPPVPAWMPATVIGGAATLTRLRPIHFIWRFDGAVRDFIHVIARLISDDMTLDDWQSAVGETNARVVLFDWAGAVDGVLTMPDTEALPEAMQSRENAERYVGPLTPPATLARYIVRGQVYIWHNPMSMLENREHFRASLRGALLADPSFGLSADDLATLVVTVAPRMQGRKYHSETSDGFVVEWYIRITFSLTTADRAKARTFAAYFNHPNRRLAPQTEGWYANTWANRLGLRAADVVKGGLPDERNWTINDALFDPYSDGSLYGGTDGVRHYY